jgi:hypothetical protein
MKFAFVLSLTTISTLAVTTAQAATSGVLALKGSVTSTFAITVTPDGTNNQTLSILSGATDFSVANVVEKSNNPAGYKVQAYSDNAGVLKNGTSDSVTYTIKYGAGAAVTLPAAAAPATVYTSAALTAPANNTQNVKLTTAGKATALAGDYTDNITFVISAP